MPVTTGPSGAAAPVAGPTKAPGPSAPPLAPGTPPTGLAGLAGAGGAGPQFMGQPAQLGGPLGTQPSADQINALLSGVPGVANTSGLSGQAPGQIDPNQLWNVFTTGVLDPAIASGNAQITGLNQQAGIDVTSQQDQSAYETQQAGLQQQELGVQRSNLGVQQQQLTQAEGAAPVEQGFQNQSFGQQQQGIVNSREQAALQNAEQQRSLRSAATANGSINTQGTGQNWSDLAQQYGLTKKGIDLTQQGLDTSEAKSKFEYGQKQQSFGQQQQLLDNAGKSLGISGEEVASRLKNTLQQLGLSTALSLSQLTDQAAAIAAGEFSPIGQFISQIFATAGIPLQTITGHGGGTQS